MAALSKARLKSALFRSVGSELGDRGFSSNASNSRFLRAVDGVTHIFRLVFLDGKPGWAIQPDVAIRIECVEEIFHKISCFETKYQAATSTIGAAVGTLLAEDARACEFRVLSETDVPTVTKEIVEVFDSFALGYFDRFGSIEAIDRELNDTPHKRTPNRGMPWLRYSSGIIVAKLVGRPNYADLEAYYYDTILNISDGFYAPDFNRLLEYLRNM